MEHHTPKPQTQKALVVWYIVLTATLLVLLKIGYYIGWLDNGIQ